MFVPADVYAVVATLLGLFLTGYALIFALGLLFQGRVDQISHEIESRPTKMGMKGALLGVTSLMVFLLIAQVPLPLLKLVGSIGVMIVLVLALMGWSAIARIMSRRLTDMDPGMGAQTAWSRAVFMLVGSSLFPLVGWMLIAPALSFVGFGAAVSVLLQRKAVTAPLS